MRILFVTDRSLAEKTQPALMEDGLLADLADSVEVADYKLQTEEYDAVLLDRALLRGRCNSSLLSWRRGGLRAHVLVLLGRDSSSLAREQGGIRSSER